MFKHTEAIEGRFLDCWGLYEGAPTQVVTGLDYLEGKLVSIMADGAVHPPQVVTGGKITLNNEYSHVLVGLPYVSLVAPYLADPDLNTGTAVGRMQRIINLDVDIYRSLGFEIIREDLEEGEREVEYKPFRVPGDLTGQPVPLYTGIYHGDYPEGFSRESYYAIRQRQPLPLTVRGIVDTFKAFE
jgi:hypothetical protein